MANTTNPVSVLFEDTTGQPVAVSITKPLPVLLSSGEGSTVAVTDGIGADASGTFTNATQTTSVTADMVDGFGTVTISINGTYANASAVFEQSDDGGVTYYPVLASQEGASQLDLGYTLLTNTNRMWRAGISGADHFRVRSTAVGSGTVNVLISVSGMPTTNGATVGAAPTIDATGSGTLTAQDAGSTTTTGQSGASIVTGTATAGSTVSIAMNGRGSISTQLSGTWAGTVSFESSVDGGTTWEPYSSHVKGASIAVTTATGNGVFLANVTGATNYRVRWTVKSSGTVVVSFVVSQEPGVVYINNAIRILDAAGVNQATIKAASTAAASTDTSLVVAINPVAPVQTARAPVSTAALGIVPVVSSALETGHIIKGSPGNLFGLNVATTSAGGYVQIFNTTTVPAAGAVTPIKAYALPANSALVIGFDPPLQCGVGICIAFSSATTPFTKTDSATAFISGDAV